MCVAWTVYCNWSIHSAYKVYIGGLSYLCLYWPSKQYTTVHLCCCHGELTHGYRMSHERLVSCWPPFIVKFNIPGAGKQVARQQDKALLLYVAILFRNAGPKARYADWNWARLIERCVRNLGLGMVSEKGVRRPPGVEGRLHARSDHLRKR